MKNSRQQKRIFQVHFIFKDDSKRDELLQTIGKVPRYLLNIDNLRQEDDTVAYQYRLDRWVEEEFARPKGKQYVLESMEEFGLIGNEEKEGKRP
jgi:hypothetical protein